MGLQTCPAAPPDPRAPDLGSCAWEGEPLPGGAGRGGRAELPVSILGRSPGSASAPKARASCSVAAEGFQLNPVAPSAPRGLFPSQLLDAHFLTLHSSRVPPPTASPTLAVFKSKRWRGEREVNPPRPLSSQARGPSLTGRHMVTTVPGGSSWRHRGTGSLGDSLGSHAHQPRSDDTVSHGLAGVRHHVPPGPASDVDPRSVSPAWEPGHPCGLGLASCSSAHPPPPHQNQPCWCFSPLGHRAEHLPPIGGLAAQPWSHPFFSA